MVLLAIALLGILIGGVGFVVYRYWRTRWRPYDPTWLVTLALEQHPDNSELIEALHACTMARRESRYYTRFAPADRPNQPGSEWQFDRNIRLESEEQGEIILDILKSGQVGGIEYLSKLFES